MQPKQSPEQQPSSPGSIEEFPCQWRSAAMSRGPCVEAAADLGGSRSPWESMALGGESGSRFPHKQEDALAVEGWFHRKG